MVLNMAARINGSERFGLWSGSFGSVRGPDFFGKVHGPDFRSGLYLSDSCPHFFLREMRDFWLFMQTHHPLSVSDLFF